MCLTIILVFSITQTNRATKFFVHTTVVHTYVLALYGLCVRCTVQIQNELIEFRICVYHFAAFVSQYYVTHAKYYSTDRTIVVYTRCRCLPQVATRINGVAVMSHQNIILLKPKIYKCMLCKKPNPRNISVQFSESKTDG